jgi:hypothetical protein
MLARAEAGSDGMLRARPEDLAASLLVFYARDGFHGVRPPSDLTGLWEGRPEDFRDGFLHEYAGRYPELAPSMAGAAEVSERVAGVPAARWLGAGVHSGRRVALAVRLSDWTQEGDRDQLRSNIALVCALLGTRGSALTLVQRELLPTTLRVPARFVHGAKRLVRWVMALWAVRGSRLWADLPARAGSG